MGRRRPQPQGLSVRRLSPRSTSPTCSSARSGTRACSSPPGPTPTTAWTARAWRLCAGTTAPWWPTSSPPRCAACSSTGAWGPPPGPEPLLPWGHRCQAQPFSGGAVERVWGRAAAGSGPVSAPWQGPSPPLARTPTPLVAAPLQRPRGRRGACTGRHLRPAV